jgi:hypothetical protein
MANKQAGVISIPILRLLLDYLPEKEKKLMLIFSMRKLKQPGPIDNNWVM